MRLALALLLASCCSTRPPPIGCVTVCGLRLRDVADCAALQAAEDRALEAFRPHVANACERFEGFAINRVNAPDGYWVDRWGRDVAGLTHCGGMVEVVNMDDDWRATSLAHELIHVLDCPARNGTHAGWEAMPDGGLRPDGNGWQYGAIDAANR